MKRTIARVSQQRLSSRLVLPKHLLKCSAVTPTIFSTPSLFTRPQQKQFSTNAIQHQKTETKNVENVTPIAPNPPSTLSYKHYFPTTKEFLDDLQKRGIMFQFTDAVDKVLDQKKANSKPVGIYAGFDPTADGLHVGNLLVLMTLRRFKKQGFPIVALVGGATGMIGDPSGKKNERPLMSVAQIDANIAEIKKEITRFLGTDEHVSVVNNKDWLNGISMIDMLRDIGRYFQMNQLLRMDSVTSRLAGEGSMTFTEFSYALLQAYDFYHLYKTHNVAVQVGGSDQWGNITCGTEFIRKRENLEAAQKDEKAAHQPNAPPTCGGITIPLLTTSDGKKFGKSEGNAVWLSAKKTSAYDFYQFFIRTTDQDVGKLLRGLTFLSLEQIAEIERHHAAAPEHRYAQRVLAQELTKAIHGQEELKKVEQATQLLFSETLNLSGLSSEEVQMLLGDAPSSELPKSEVVGKPAFSVLKQCGMFKSTSTARQLIRDGGLYMNNRRETNEKYEIQESDLIDGKVIVFRSGKKNYHLLQVK